MGEKKKKKEKIIGKDNRKYHIKLLCFMRKYWNSMWIWGLRKLCSVLDYSKTTCFGVNVNEEKQWEQIESRANCESWIFQLLNFFHCLKSLFISPGEHCRNNHTNPANISSSGHHQRKWCYTDKSPNILLLLDSPLLRMTNSGILVTWDWVNLHYTYISVPVD